MPGPTSSNYDVTADGQRFVMVKDATGPPSDRVVVVLNFAEEVRAKQRTLAAAGTNRAN